MNGPTDEADVRLPDGRMALLFMVMLVSAAGIITSVNGSAYVAAPAIGVWLCSHSQWLAWGTMEALAVVVAIIGVFVLEKDGA